VSMRVCMSACMCVNMRVFACMRERARVHMTHAVFALMSHGHSYVGMGRTARQVLDRL
jgi:hypothetical protein